MKICCSCKEQLSFEDFASDKTTKDGYRYKCKKCTRLDYLVKKPIPVISAIDGEIWKDVVGWEYLYEVSSLGNVRGKEKCVQNINGHKKLYRTIPARMLKPQHSKTNYQSVNLYSNSKMTKKPIHRLVATAFIPNPDKLPCVNHKDFNPSNNQVGNLEWCTYQYNYDYSKDRITASLQRGEKHFFTKLTDDEVREIKLLKGIMKNCDIARKFNTSPPVICNILNGKKWKHI